MKKILLMSDTHGYLDKTIWSYVDQCDQIWHAGDIGSISIADKLAKHKSLIAVYGNIDNHIVRSTYPKHILWQVEGMRIWMTHIGGYPNKYPPHIKKQIINHKPNIFISGHSHILKVVYDHQYNMLTLNPGAAGKKGIHKVKTMLRLHIHKGKVKHLDVIEWSK